jgi:hypothetical protein
LGEVARDRFLALDDELRHAVEQRGAFEDADAGQVPLRRASRVDRTVDVGRDRDRHLGDRLAGRRAAHGGVTAADRRNPPPSDEGLEPIGFTGDRPCLDHR